MWWTLNDKTDQELMKAVTVRNEAKLPTGDEKLVRRFRFGREGLQSIKH